MAFRVDGTRLLNDFFESKKPLTQAEAAKQLNIFPSAFNAYLNGGRPRDVVRARIEKWSSGKVPADSWRNSRERAAISGQEAAFVPDSIPDSERRPKRAS